MFATNICHAALAHFYSTSPVEDRVEVVHTGGMSLEQHLQTLFTPEGIQNPYPAYSAAREHGELVVIKEWNSAFAFGVDAVNALFRHPNASANRMGGMPTEWPGAGLLEPMMLFHDHASHTRLRGLVSQAFTPRAVAETRGFIAALADELLDEYAQQGGDFIAKVAVPFPMLVIAELMGLEAVERERFRAWASTLVALFDGSTYDPNQAGSMARDIAEMRAYFRETADALQHSSRPGVLAAMARAEADGERLSSDELLSNAALLLAAGFETTTNLLAGSMVAFAEHPQEWQKLLGQPDLIPNAVEECLRFVSPVQATSRVLRGDLNWQNHTLPSHMALNLMLGAANRDPGKFANPDVLDIARPNADKHVAFASGPHYCLGAPLARLEGQVFFERLGAKYPHFHVPEQTLRYRHNFTVRGLTGLEVRLKD